MEDPELKRFIKYKLNQHQPKKSCTFIYEELFALWKNWIRLGEQVRKFLSMVAVYGLFRIDDLKKLRILDIEVTGLDEIIIIIQSGKTNKAGW